MIIRDISKNIVADWDYKKAIVLLGPRQVGKTTLIEKLVVYILSTNEAFRDEFLSDDKFENEIKEIIFEEYLPWPGLDLRQDQ